MLKDPHTSPVFRWMRRCVEVGSEWVIDEIESDTAVRASAQAGKLVGWLVGWFGKGWLVGLRAVYGW